MKNPAMISAATRERGEVLMDRADDLQRMARDITRALGRAETIYRRTADTFRHGGARDAVAAEVKLCRRWLRDNGYDAGHVCHEFRDPGAFAFCDGGGATPENIDQ